jgi:ribosomal protein S14
MCLIDTADCVSEFSTERHRVARKPHTCGECGRSILARETYLDACGLADGTFWTAKMCRHCFAVAEWLSESCNGYLHTAVIEDFREHAEGKIGYLRAVVGARRKWSRFDGTGLMPVPILPPLET